MPIVKLASPSEVNPNVPPMPEPTWSGVPSEPVNENPVTPATVGSGCTNHVLPVGVGAVVGRSAAGVAKNSLCVTSVGVSAPSGSWIDEPASATER